jgi:hypothetical protein
MYVLKFSQVISRVTVDIKTRVKVDPDDEDRGDV